jgi:outer membrane protein assembly factor BamB
MFALAVAFFVIGPRSASAQVGVVGHTGEFELTDAVQLDRADNATLASLERAKAHLADRQWTEAVETFRQVMENANHMLLGVTPQRYVSVRDYCSLQLAAMPHEPLSLYRSRVDPLARKWYEEGVATLNRVPLVNVVEHAFASSWADKAMLALGELALESGDYASARWYWERILPASPPAGTPRTWPAYPDTKLDLAAVRARLVLVSILEGSAARAREELAQFVRLHPNARGRLGGQDAKYSETLELLLADSDSWAKPSPTHDWPTFAANAQRNPPPAEPCDVNQVEWRLPIRTVEPTSKPVPRVGTAPRKPDDPASLLSYYPIVVGGLVLVCNRAEILAVDLATGKPPWGSSSAAIYRDQFDDSIAWSADPLEMLGASRHTLTVHDGRLYARMGNPATGRPQVAAAPVQPGALVFLDLDGQGRLLRKIMPEEGWAFEGSPLADGPNVYVAMRRNDIRPQAHVACFDAQSGTLRWRRFVCAAENPARGMLYQRTHNLLTLHHDTLYYNTNLGAVAAISAHDGQIQWVSLYPRARHGDLFHLAPHWQRDLTPCLYNRGTLLVAPADSPRIFAFDAANGQIVWHTGTEASDAVHLLGVVDDRLVASGDRLYWIELAGPSPGKVIRRWPDSNERMGFGRGVLSTDKLYWPARDRIYVFDARTAEPRRVIDLAPYRTTGGNLLIASGRLLIATAKELVALGQGGKPKAESGINEPLAAYQPASQSVLHPLPASGIPLFP